MRIVFFGTPEFSAEILRFLKDKPIEIVAIVTREDKPKGRGLTLEPTFVKQVALTLFPTIPIFQPKRASDPLFIEELKKFDADYFVVVAFGQILKQELLDVPKKGCINVHTSLLPKLRGAAPIQRAIMNGESKTGVTIMQMSLEMDAGDILKQVEVPIPLEMTFGELREALCHASKAALVDVLLNPPAAIPQEHSKATFAPKVELEDCQIDFKKDALSQHNLVRGSNPEPGAFCFVKIKDQIKKLKIFATRLRNEEGVPCQKIEYGKKGIVIACEKGSLQLLEVQLEGKKRMPAEAFSCGIDASQLFFT